MFTICPQGKEKTNQTNDGIAPVGCAHPYRIEAIFVDDRKKPCSLALGQYCPTTVWIPSPFGFP